MIFGPPPRLALDPLHSSIQVFTFKEGFFAALAHDLELRAEGLGGSLEGEVATVQVPRDRLAVVGAVKNGRTEALSPSDVIAIEKQIREVVLRGAEVVSARGQREGDTLRLDVTGPGAVQRRVIKVEASRTSVGVRAAGAVDLSLKALGIAEVRGPLNAFRLKDSVRVVFELVFVAGDEYANVVDLE